MKLRNFITILTSLVVATASLVTTVHAAPNANFAFSLDKSTVTTGEQVAVTINVTASEFEMASGRANVQYDTTLLDYVSMDESNSVMPVGLSFTHDTSTGIVTSIRGRFGSGYTGTGKYVTFNFTAKATGTASFAFASGSRVLEAGTGDEKPITLGGASLTINSPIVSDPSPSSTATATATATATIAATPTPTSTATPTSQPTKTPTPNASKAPTKTPTPKPATPKPATTPAPSNTDLSKVSIDQSIVEFSTTSAVADGIDTITINVTVKDGNAKVLKDVEPSLTGLRPNSDTASPFVYDEATESWSSNITSTEAGIITVLLSAQDVTLKTQDLTFTEPFIENIDDLTTDGGSSFGTTIFIGLLFLILLLVLLFLLWRRMKKHEEEGDDDAAFPGSDVPPPSSPDEPTPSAPAEPEQPAEDKASFNPNEALQRTPTTEDTNPQLPQAPPAIPL